MRQDRLEELDGVRALMAWWVVLGHVAWVVSDRAGALVHNTSAVLIFMALSGFVIAALIESRREPYLAYLTRRVFRLWPAYLIALLFSAATLAAQASAEAHCPFQPSFAAGRLEVILTSMRRLWPNLAAHVLAIHGLVPTKLLPDGALTILSPAWSLSVEVQFYLVAPPVIGMVRSGPAGILAALFLAASLVFLGLHGPLRYNSAFIGHYVHWFAVGIGSFYLWSQRRGRWAIGAVVALMAALTIYTLWRREVAGVVWAGVIGLVIWPTRLNARLGRGLLKRLGDASYSTYIFHLTLLYLVAFALNGLGLHRPTYLGLLTLGTVVSTLVVSLASFRWIERPAMRFGAALAARLQRGAAIAGGWTPQPVEVAASAEAPSQAPLA
jgi:peptidoglycan/LPS O-acetylase OafA/YrhL